MEENRALSRGSATRVCKYKPCGAAFTPKRVTQVFCSPSCKTKHTMSAYEAGLKVIGSKGMHNRKINNHYLQKILACLSNGEPWTTRQLHEATKIENVSTSISELRRAGVTISKAKFVRITETGAKIYEYRLSK